MAHSLHVDQVFGIEEASKRSVEATNIGPEVKQPPQLLIEDLGDNKYFLALAPAMLEIYRQVKLLEGIDLSYASEQPTCLLTSVCDVLKA